ncbi:hypothetical protein Pyrfu_1953 [Pyrolobus fumarii 1A]|uniref:Uncharacterized protein n=1 Tax=Pyrolobus fumarii (strain DSM 11204 / 1A) TaxID=694429 RepID=G0EDK2_PYRF1|nr:hypothetical protein [Pyrolobus fumarii]AEM39806.1 hypothetical protein Pyrfu_1953 [Pyrolobus fumarii 1A]
MGETRSISSVLALTLILVLTIIVALAAVSIMFYWYSWSVSYVEQLRVLGDSYIEATSDYTIVALHLMNEGKRSAVIVSVTVGHWDVPLSYFQVIIEAGNARKLTSAIEVGPGSTVWLRAIVPASQLPIAANQLDTVKVEMLLDSGRRITAILGVIRAR